MCVYGYTYMYTYIHIHIETQDRKKIHMCYVHTYILIKIHDDRKKIHVLFYICMCVHNHLRTSNLFESKTNNS